MLGRSNNCLFSVWSFSNIKYSNIKPGTKQNALPYLPGRSERDFWESEFAPLIQFQGKKDNGDKFFLSSVDVWLASRPYGANTVMIPAYLWSTEYCEILLWNTIFIWHWLFVFGKYYYYMLYSSVSSINQVLRNITQQEIWWLLFIFVFCQYCLLYFQCILDQPGFEKYHSTWDLYLVNTICICNRQILFVMIPVLWNITAREICIWWILFVYVFGKYYLSYFQFWETVHHMKFVFDEYYWYLYLANTIYYTPSVSSINRVLRNITAREKAGRKERQTRFPHHPHHFDHDDHDNFIHHDHEFLLTEQTGRAGREKKKERKERRRRPAAGLSSFFLLIFFNS